MSTKRPWSLKKSCLNDALKRWYERDSPDAETRAAVHNWLMDVLEKGLAMGQEDPPGSGVWFDRIAEANVGVTWIPNDDMSICVAIIIDAD